ncbi:hypothetical protein [Burkholderia sp. D-99]|uniref:hypothetical protein n=1 Tax=Burkholderia sp. D-99 TaxID=2717316 RepID=UPI00141F131E|nr:hypothetical protein [Burkholderia sp. D-99]NHV27974.1 hypothetical protein [Burkholderia sp. D-99]
MSRQTGWSAQVLGMVAGSVGLGETASSAKAGASGAPDRPAASSSVQAGRKSGEGFMVTDAVRVAMSSIISTGRRS